MKVSIITLCHNTLDHMKNCFNNLTVHTEGIGMDKEWIVVDNNSSDELLINYFKYMEKYPGVKIIRNEQNLTFAIGNNQAVKEAQGKWLCFLNSDTIPQRRWLEELLDCAERNNADIVGARMYFPHTEMIQHAGIVQREDGIFTHRYYNQPANKHKDIMEESEMMVTAACMLIKKSVFEELGSFDEGYVWGYEDVDLNLKAISKDLKIFYCPKAFLYHTEHGTDQNINKSFDINLKLLNKKWGVLK